MADPTISFTDRYSSTLQPLLLLATDYLAIIIAEWCAVGGRDIVLDLLGRKTDWFELNNFYFYLFVPLIFMVFLHWGRTYIRLLSIGEMIRRTFYSVIYAIVVSIVVLFIAGKAPVVSRLFIAFLGCFVFVFVCGSRLLVRYLCNRANILLSRPSSLVPTTLLNESLITPQRIRFLVLKSSVLLTTNHRELSLKANTHFWVLPIKPQESFFVPVYKIFSFWPREWISDAFTLLSMRSSL